MRMPSPIRTALVLAALALAVCLLGCSKGGHGSPQGGSNASPAKAKIKRSVELTQAKQEKMPSSVETVGYLEGEGETNVAAGGSGIVEEVCFREGDWVVKDLTLLARVEPKKYEAMLAQAKANLE